MYSIIYYLCTQDYHQQSKVDVFVTAVEHYFSFPFISKTFGS